jgi:hypothetical protein
MTYNPNEDPKTKRLNEWLRQGQSEGLVDDRLAWVSGKEDAIEKWLKRGKESGVLLLAGELSEACQRELQTRFRWVLAFLLTMMGAGVSAIFWLGKSPTTSSHLLTGVVAGLLGSATAAFISCLDRRANGFEDKYGNAFPDPMERKERFGKSMSYWLMCRPFLGVVMGVIAYLWVASGLLPGMKPPDSSAEDFYRVAFVGSIAGLFAKTLYDILQNVLKGILKS